MPCTPWESFVRVYPLEGDLAVIHYRGGLGIRRRGTVSVWLIQELDSAAGDQQDLGREPVAVLAVLAPLAGLQLARDVDQAALLRVLLHHLHQAVLEGDDAVPLGAVHLVPRVFVEVALIGRCAVERRRLLAGANPARQLSLQPVAIGAGDGGNDMA